MLGLHEEENAYYYRCRSLAESIPVEQLGHEKEKATIKLRIESRKPLIAIRRRGTLE